MKVTAMLPLWLFAKRRSMTPAVRVLPPEYSSPLDHQLDSTYAAVLAARDAGPETLPAPLTQSAVTCKGACQQGHWSCPHPVRCAGPTRTPYTPAETADKAFEWFLTVSFWGSVIGLTALLIALFRHTGA